MLPVLLFCRCPGRASLHIHADAPDGAGRPHDSWGRAAADSRNLCGWAWRKWSKQRVVWLQFEVGHGVVRKGMPSGRPLARNRVTNLGTFLALSFVLSDYLQLVCSRNDLWVFVLPAVSAGHAAGGAGPPPPAAPVWHLLPAPLCGVQRQSRCSRSYAAPPQRRRRVSDPAAWARCGSMQLSDRYLSCKPHFISSPIIGSCSAKVHMLSRACTCPPHVDAAGMATSRPATCC